MNKIAIFGTGGFAKELLDLALDQGYTDIVFLEKNAQEHQTLLGFPVLTESNVELLKQTDFAIGIADPKIRKKIAHAYPQLHYPNLIHTQASLGYGIRKQLQAAQGVIIAAGVRITNSCSFGDFILVSFNSTIGHDCQLHDYVSIMPGVNVSGCVQVQTGVYIGTNAAILPGQLHKLKTLGEYSVIGANAVVNRDTTAHTTYVGAPAKELRKQ